MSRIFSLGLMLALAIGMNTNIANAQWSDDFDSYANGELLDGQNGWNGWWLDPDARGAASNAFSNSAPNSIAILNNADGGVGISTDAVNEMGNPTSGQWTFTCQQYLPSGGQGSQFFIMLSSYTEGGDIAMAWTTQLQFNFGDGMVVDANGLGGTTTVVFDQWIEIRVEIDLDNDTCEEYYNNFLMYSGSWSDRNFNDPDQVAEIGALDLYGGDDMQGVDGPAYYDDCDLSPAATGGTFCPTSWNLFRGILLEGDLADFCGADGNVLKIQPGLTINTLEAPVWPEVFGNVGAGPGPATDISVTSQAGTPGLTYTVEARNYTTGLRDVIGTQGESFNSDQTVSFPLTSDQVDSNGDVEARIGWRKTGLTINFPWEVRIDDVSWIVQ